MSLRSGALHRVVSLNDWRALARHRLPRVVFDFADGGTEDELGLLRNEQAFGRYRLLPRYLIDVSTRSQRVELFGQVFDSPFGVAPMGLASLFRPGAELMLARAAVAANIPFGMSGASAATIEEVAALAPAHAWYQLYANDDRAVSLDLIARAAAAGIRTLVLTVDIPVRAKRERNTRNGLHMASLSRPTPRVVLEALRHPGWCLDYWRSGGMPPPRSYAPYVGENPDAARMTAYMAAFRREDQTWNDLLAYRRAWPGNFVLKGVLGVDDARRAVQAGVDGLIVSNHGGRQLDRAPSPVEVLPAIVEAVGARAVVMLDSGVRRGSDVVTALALGARLAFVGRPFLFGAAVAAQAGADRAIEILRDEVDTALGQIGCPDIKGLGADYLLDTRLAGAARHVDSIIG